MKRNKHGIIIFTIGMAFFGLQSCTEFFTGHSSSPGNYDYSNYHDESDGNYEGGQYVPRARHVNVPNSYHVSGEHSPASHKDRDRNWVNNQNPNGYTIELENNEKASSVANTLQKTPKNQRTAQIKYLKNGKKRYTGVYGTYKDKAAAKRALEKLPANVRKKAGIQKWSNVQENTKSAYTAPKSSGPTRLPAIQ